MKNNKIYVSLLLLIIMVLSLCLSSCDNGENPTENPNTNDPTNPPITDPTDPIEDEKYTIAFFNNNQLVAMVEAKAGEFVDIPDESLLFSDPRYFDPRYTFAGWEGIDDADFQAGKVEVFNQNAFYNSKWDEMFGTENKFSVTEVPTGKAIVTDGVFDETYLDAEAVTINTVTAGSTDTTATMYFMFDDEYFYIFADVKDSTVFTRDYSYSGEQWTEHNDAIEFWIDLLHDDSKISPTWTGGWGGDYRGEPGPMCEAHFKINAGYNPNEQGRFGAGSEAIWDGWWSNACNEDEVSFGISKVTETGYTVEYRISLTNTNIPDSLRMNDGQEIGIGIKIYDKKESGGNKNSPATNVITLEAINHNMSGPKKLSNFIVKANPNQE